MVKDLSLNLVQAGPRLVRVTETRLGSKTVDRHLVSMTSYGSWPSFSDKLRTLVPISSLGLLALILMTNIWPPTFVSVTIGIRIFSKSEKGMKILFQNFHFVYCNLEVFFASWILSQIPYYALVYEILRSFKWTKKWDKNIGNQICSLTLFLHLKYETFFRDILTKVHWSSTKFYDSDNECILILEEKV